MKHVIKSLERLCPLLIFPLHIVQQNHLSPSQIGKCISSRDKGGLKENPSKKLFHLNLSTYSPGVGGGQTKMDAIFTMPWRKGHLDRTSLTCHRGKVCVKMINLDDDCSSIKNMLISTKMQHQSEEEKWNHSTEKLKGSCHWSTMSKVPPKAVKRREARSSCHCNSTHKSQM